MTLKAAGVLYATEAGSALFLKRGPGGDHPGEWCFPGGKLEAGETAIQAAVRESEEELGFKVRGDLQPWARSFTPAHLEGCAPNGPPGDPLAAEPVDYETFLCRVGEEFTPTVNGEHVGYAWAPIDQPPEPLHPGCRVALELFGANELDVARAIRDGRLTSPQKFGGFWLFDMRVTGTGLSYRPALNEYVYRRPENYLTEEFLARCNGLPVIVQHPKEDVLDSKQFARRIVGTCFLPYLRGDEVWAVVKVYDDKTVELLRDAQVSTSPNVLLRSGEGLKFKTEDGRELLIENDAALVDHLAICEVGVWDKGGEPAGVVSVEAEKEAKMAEEEERAAREDKARKDAAEEQGRKDAAMMNEKLDKFLSMADGLMGAMDSVSARLDALERKDKKDEGKCEHGKAMEDACAECKRDAKKDSAEEEKVKKDAEEAEKKAAEEKAEKDRKDAAEEQAKKDAAMRDSAVTKDDLKDLETRLVRSLGDEDMGKLVARQATANRVFEAFGDSAPRPMPGETEIGYRLRVANELKKHSPAGAKMNLERVAMADSAGFEAIEKMIFEDALKVARDPATVPPGTLRVRKDSTTSPGHEIRTYYGDPLTWMDQFMIPGRAAGPNSLMNTSGSPPVALGRSH